jgi:hypothetical protein
MFVSRRITIKQDKHQEYLNKMVDKRIKSGIALRTVIEDLTKSIHISPFPLTVQNTILRIKRLYAGHFEPSL